MRKCCCYAISLVVYINCFFIECLNIMRLCFDLLINDKIIVDVAFNIIDLRVIIRANPFVVNDKFVTKDLKKVNIFKIYKKVFTRILQVADSMLDSTC